MTTQRRCESGSGKLWATTPTRPLTPTFIAEMEMMSFWRNFRHWLHCKLSFWQLPVQPVNFVKMTICSFQYDCDVKQRTRTNFELDSIVTSFYLCLTILSYLLIYGIPTPDHCMYITGIRLCFIKVLRNMFRSFSMLHTPLWKSNRNFFSAQIFYHLFFAVCSSFYTWYMWGG